MDDIGDRSISGICYKTSLEVKGSSVREDARFKRIASSMVLDGTPDWFHSAFIDALDRGRVASHSVGDEFSFGIYPREKNIGNDWHQRVFEPLRFKGDPENIFKVIVCINEFDSRSANVPYGGGVSLVIPTHRDDLVSFREDWLNEVRGLIDPKVLEDKRGKAFLRWIPGI
jgi:hypothetical protein